MDDSPHRGRRGRAENLGSAIDIDLPAHVPVIVKVHGAGQVE
jgi:hypothetical protein